MSISHVAYTAEETLRPERTIPRALAIGIVVVTMCYVALNAVYFSVLPLERVEKSTRVAADVATTLLGAPGGAAISGLVMFSVFGAMTGSMLAAPRVLCNGDGRPDRPVGGRRAPAVPHSAPRHVLQAISASVLVWSGIYRSAIHPRDLHRVDLLRDDRGWHLPAAAPS